MKSESFRILQISTFDLQGGAERVAWNLFTSYKNRGYQSWLAVGFKTSEDSDVIEFQKNLLGPWSSFWVALSRRAGKYTGKIRGAGRLRQGLERLGQSGKWFDELRGREDFRYPETWQFLNFSPAPDIVHCHNLHGHYFDLRILPELSQKIPTVLTLHDAWLLSGHCAHSFECERWKSGCGECPDLTIYPSIEKDATAFNWHRKKEIYKKSRLHVATPSQWLMDKVQESMLVGGIVESRVIPNGVDLAIFSPSDKVAARNKFGLPSSANIVLLASYDNHQWKDSPTIRAAVELMSRTNLDQLVFIVLGNKTGIEKIGSAELRFISEQKEPADVAEYYRAADLYIHASKADTFPNSVLESLACGTPVIATAIGGIPEQIKSLEKEKQEATGVLVPPKNPVLISQSAIELLKNRDRLLQMGKNASRDAMERFGLNKQIDSYLNWYSEILSKSKPF